MSTTADGNDSVQVPSTTNGMDIYQTEFFSCKIVSLQPKSMLSLRAQLLMNVRLFIKILNDAKQTCINLKQNLQKVQHLFLFIELQ